MNEKYICCECEEDITDKVINARNNQIPAVEFVKINTTPKNWRVVVQCDNGHPNVFHD